MLLILSNSPSFFDVSDFPLYPPSCERLAFLGPSIFHVKRLMLFASERPSFSPLDVQQPKSHHSLVPHRYSGDTITIHPCHKYLTWFLQAFSWENRIWDWEYWVGWGEGGWGGILEEFQTICLFLFFIFHVNSMYLPVPQHARGCQNYLRTSLISRAKRHTPPFAVIINILYTKLPSEQGTWQGSAAVSAASQFLNFSFRNGRFQSQNCGYFAPHLLPSAGGRR